MTKRPRIAFCFSGQARTLDQTYLFFQKNLFDAAKEQGFDYDVFCAVEDDEDIEKVTLLNPTKIEKIKSSEVEKIIEKRYGDYINSYLVKNSHIGFDIFRFLQQLYKVTRSINIINGNYDIILRLRFDVFFFNALNFNKIMAEIKNGTKVISNIPPQQKMTHIFGLNLDIIWEICDFFFIGTNESLHSLVNSFDNFQDNIKFLIVKKPKILLIILNFIVGFFKKINKKLGHGIFPVMPLEYIFRKLFNIITFCPEVFYYYCFVNNKILIEKTNISWILLRKNIEESYVNLVPKTKYEI